MGPRTVFTKEQVVEGAIDLIRQKGEASLSVRNIAEHIGASTQPIYRLFENIGELEDEIVTQLVNKLLERMISTRDEMSSFLSIGVGFLQFAKEERNLFIYLYFAGRHTASKLFKRMEMGSLYEKMRQDHFLNTFSDEQLERLLHDMTIYSLGIAAEICFEKEKHTIEEYRALMEQAGGRLVIADYLMMHPEMTMKDIRRKHEQSHTEASRPKPEHPDTSQAL